jgi:Ca-activated chloride channel family protein
MRRFDAAAAARGREAYHPHFLPVLLILLALPAAAQTPPPAPPAATAPGAAPGAAAKAAPGAVPGSAAEEPAPVPEHYDDPWDAYQAGAWSQALQGFVDQQVERPEDPAAALNVGSAHYRLGEWAEAQQAFTEAALAADPALSEQAFYNLGNTAYRQGRLEEAVELYKKALELDPEDGDAKFNLEFVRDEIRRRHEEAQKRQQEQQQQKQQQEQSQDGQQDQQDQQDQQGQQEQQEPQDQQGQQGQQEQQQQAAGGGADRDQDGLPDATETGAQNPTDPDNPDSDGDGLADGQEDLNHNGRVDAGETDPNRADSDGDGTPDGAEAGAPQGAQGQQAAAEASPEGLTPEEAERYLQALEEMPPEQRVPRQPGRRARPAKDW